MISLPIINSADQEFAHVLAGVRCSFHIALNSYVDRWYMDLGVDDTPIFKGRKIVPNADLLEPFNLGIGVLFAISRDANPAVTRAALVEGRATLVHASPDEVAFMRANPPST